MSIVDTNALMLQVASHKTPVHRQQGINTPVLPQIMETVIGEVQVKSVFARYAAIQKPLNDLVQAGRFTAAAGADANGCPAGNFLDSQVPRYPGLRTEFLKTKDD